MSATLQTVWDAIGRPDDFLHTIADSRRAQSRIHGHGLFSTRERALGEHVVTLDGQAVATDQMPELLHTLEWNALAHDLLLVRPIRTSYGFINHSRTPNMTIGTDSRTVTVARAVAAGDELTLDYLDQPLPARYFDAPQAAYLRVA